MLLFTNLQESSLKSNYKSFHFHYPNIHYFTTVVLEHKDHGFNQDLAMKRLKDQIHGANLDHQVKRMENQDRLANLAHQWRPWQTVGVSSVLERVCT